MRVYIVEIKEVGRNNILTSSLECESKTKEELIRFWGLDEPDVEWYQLYQIVDGGEVEI